MSHHFLVELGTEELPPTSLKELSRAFLNGVEQGFANKKLAFENIQAFATPRRLTILVEGLASETPKEEISVWGPPAKIAFDAEGKPTKAAEAFASKNDIAVDQLQSANDGKQDKLLAVKQTGGEATETLLPAIVLEALNNLPIKKRMRWGASREEFVRPVQWLLALLDTKVLDTQIYGVKAGNTTRGHRFHCNREIVLTSPLDYAKVLENEGKVLVDFDKRQQLIKAQVEDAAKKIGGEAVIDQDLLDEVTGLVEWPVALSGKFEASFLEVPAEALISSMKEHQKYFHIVDKDGKLMPYFITLSNIESQDPAQVIDGNERVIRPRLADAAFFFDTDKKTSLETQREKLKSVVFQAKLGTIFDKTERIQKLALAIAEKLNADQTLVARAAELCKSDLVTTMVYEFADMQGIAGYHYALNDGEPEEVALAMNEQYLPRFAGDELPSTSTGSIIALADRLDTITGIFGIGQKPTGSKDPFGLRRASLGALRLLVEKSYALDLAELIELAAGNFADLPNRSSVVQDVLSYMLDRFKSWYEDANIAAEIFQSVSAKQLTCPLDINHRVYAVQAFTQLAEAQALAAANKRVSNILAKHEGDIPGRVDNGLLQESAEKELASALQQAFNDVTPLLEKNAYTDALTELAKLRAPVDTFFDDVMVMAEDTALRDNRLALLSQLRGIFLEVADISCLVVKA
ncbi:Glycine--tRNA ligase beta subunit [Thalassocella blandensis]|nr:Glycine--tRNA ligase beta subunit [Thalassocella blandensis]